MVHYPDSIEATAMEAMVAGPQSVELTTRRAQRSYTRAFDSLPVKGMERAQQTLESWGFSISEDPMPENPLFFEVKAPDGWTLGRTDHSSWNDIIDAQGGIRGHVYYKGSFYDRDAFFSVYSRYHVTAEQEEVAPPKTETRSRRAWVDEDGREVPSDKVIYSTYDGPFVLRAVRGQDDGYGDEIDYEQMAHLRQTTINEEVEIEPAKPFSERLSRYVVRDRADPHGPPLHATEWMTNAEHTRIRRSEEHKVWMAEKFPQIEDASVERDYFECVLWLDDNYPEHGDPLAYWDNSEPATAPSV